MSMQTPAFAQKIYDPDFGPPCSPARLHGFLAARQPEIQSQKAEGRIKKKIISAFFILTSAFF
jgi:hypothetical protein